jgi:hypothetical protein
MKDTLSELNSPADFIDVYVKAMIGEGYYRYKPDHGGSVMFNGEQTWPYSVYAKTRNLKQGFKKDGTPKYIDLNTIDMNRSDFPIITKKIYDISLPFGKVDGKAVINTAKKLSVEFRIEGIDNGQDVSIFWSHLDYLCGNVDQGTKEWVKDWLADIFQNPNDKKGTALVFVGKQGCGKSIFFDELMKALLGEYHHYANGKDYNEQFNLELKDKLLINFDEGFATKSKSSEAKLKSFITQPQFKLQGKGTNATTILNPARAVFTTNDRFAINTAEDDRRFAIFRTVKEDYITPEYFDKFLAAVGNREMLEKFMFELTTREIKGRLNMPPMTEEKISQKTFSADKVSEWFDFIISTRSDYKAQLRDNSQSKYNWEGRVWNRYTENERWMFKENGLESFLNFRGKNDGVETTNKLFSALKAHLEDNREWSLSNENQRIEARDGFVWGDKNTQQRMWVFKKKCNNVAKGGNS